MRQMIPWLMVANLLGMPGWVCAQARSAEIHLAAWKVLPDAATPERFRLEKLDHLEPGDTIEYEATYANPHGVAARGVQITLPVPAEGLVYLDGPAGPPQAASLDGRHYESIPLMRTERLADGRSVRRRVPAAEYRYLRWDLGDVGAGEQRQVRARMRMQPLAGPGAAARAVADPRAADGTMPVHRAATGDEARLANSAAPAAWGR